MASVVQRLAVLLSAGVAPASAWEYLAEVDDGSVLPAVAASVGSGKAIAESILDAAVAAPSADTAWRGLAAAWRVATEAGAPLAPTLRHVAGTLRDLAQTDRDIQVALEAPAATARMVMVLPAVGVLFGLVLGFDTLGTLLTTPPGLVCLVLGLLLMGGARAWNARLIRSATPVRLTPGLILDLMAIAVSGGASISRARATVDDARSRCGLVDDTHGKVIDGILALSQRAGVPAAVLLRSEADEARRVARSDGARTVAKLSVKLMLPLGICVLPAFMLLGVAPLLIAVISSTVSVI